MSRGDAAVLLDIAHAAHLIQKFIAGSDPEAFATDELRQSAVLHQLLVIGEAVKRLSTEIRNANPEIPWGKMAGMRDRLIHAYDTVDLEAVWATAATDTPDLLKRLGPLLPLENP